MITFYDNAFSPFARKVRMVLEYKGLAFEPVDGLRLENHDLLRTVNGRIEVPALVDGEAVVVNSSDIVAYLDHQYPERPVLPADPALRARARAWERTADDTVDPILLDISLWLWADRPDKMPAGLLATAQADMEQVYETLDRELAGADGDGFICGAFSIADIALFPHLVSVHALRVPWTKEHHQYVHAWIERMKSLELCQADMLRTRDYLKTLDRQDVETTKIFWRGDRIEWLLARGYHEWFVGEIEAGRVLWPGLGLPPAPPRQ